MSDYVTVGGDRVEFEHARMVIAGYCFGERSVSPVVTKTRKQFGATSSAPISVRRWGYHSYDCIRAEPDDGLSRTDLLIGAGLNARLDVETVTTLMAVASRVNPLLAQLPPSDFWTLGKFTGAKQGTIEWKMNQIWAIATSFPGINHARFNKTLHHKRPCQYPLYDSLTFELLAEAAGGFSGIWDLISSELQANEWEKLEEWFKDFGAGSCAVPIYRVRMHDILLWCRATREEDAAAVVGAQLLQTGAPKCSLTPH